MGKCNGSRLALLVFLSVQMLGIGCYAADPVSADGEIEVHGKLQEGPCLVSMRSAFQDVVLDNTALANLHNPGDTGKPQQIILHLLGCRTTETEMELLFLAKADLDDPNLLKIDGISGVGLRLLNRDGRMIIPGIEHKALFTVGNDLVYTVIPVRTTAPMSTGNFSAAVNFGIRYE